VLPAGASKQVSKLKIFISWSGEWSKEVAQFLRQWLPEVLGFTEPWLSSEEVEKGAQWPAEMYSALETTHVGIVCLTPDNIADPWILFEAGSLSKAVRRNYVCTFLHGLSNVDVSPPLSLFQATEATKKEEVSRLITTLNQATEEPVSSEQCQRALERYWPDLEGELKKISSKATLKGSPLLKRSDRELLEEILELTRGQLQNTNISRHELSELLHAIQTPLHIIQGYIEIAQELEPSTKELLQNAAKQVRRISDLLSFLMDPKSRIDPLKMGQKR